MGEPQPINRAQGLALSALKGGVRLFSEWKAAQRALWGADERCVFQTEPLERRNLVQQVYVGGGKYGYALTDLGRETLREWEAAHG